MTERRSYVVPALIYAALCTAVVSSLGMLLVPSIAAEFRVPVSTAQWMLTVNLLVGAVATPVMGRLSDGPRTRRLLLISLLIILAGSVVAALAPNFVVFLVGRAMQGLSYGIVPVTIAMARRYAAPARVQSSISTLSVTVASGIGVGYPLTGVIAGVSDYHWAFWFAALFVSTAIILVFRTLPDGAHDSVVRQPFDTLGATLLGLGLGLLLLGISEGENWGWGTPPTIGMLIAAVALLAAWATVELASSHPLINLRVLRNSDVLFANGTAIGLGAAMYIALSVGSLVAQAPRATGYGLALPVVWAGFVMFPLSVGSLTANRIVRRLAQRIKLSTLLPVGSTIILGASVLLWVTHRELWLLLLGMLGLGLGMGASYAAMPALIARTVAAEELGSLVSFNQVLRTVGSAFGTALARAILAANTSPDGHSTDAGITGAFALGALVCSLVTAALVTHAFSRHRRRSTQSSRRGQTCEQ
jgi:predicted MFS family arabinose efflux permease